MVAYLASFIFIVAMVSVGYTEPNGSSNLANATTVDVDGLIEHTSVDDVVSSLIAAKAASVSDLSVAINIANLATTNSVKSQMSQTGSTSFSSSKPQLIESTDDNRLVKTYNVLSGDTIEKIATKFEISTQTIKWNNDLESDNLVVGQSLRILPIDGILYTVKSSDTISSIVSKYETNETSMIVYNDLDVDSLKTGSQIILPDGILPLNERPGYVAPVVYYTALASDVGFGGRTWFIKVGTANTGYYAFGNCTRYAYNRRIELGLPVGTRWGNASTWSFYAASEGYTVNRTPSVGAIIQNGGGYGHVAIVESIASNGDITISEMNARVSGGGYNIVSGRIIFASDVAKYNYIH